MLGENSVLLCYGQYGFKLVKQFICNVMHLLVKKFVCDILHRLGWGSQLDLTELQASDNFQLKIEDVKMNPRTVDLSRLQ